VKGKWNFQDWILGARRGELASTIVLARLPSLAAPDDKNESKFNTSQRQSSSERL
jgi:hypothetical protein